MQATQQIAPRYIDPTYIHDYYIVLFHSRFVVGKNFCFSFKLII